MYRPIDTDSVVPGRRQSDDDEGKAGAELDTEAPATFVEVKPNMATPVLEPSSAKP
jgi:hypothetical protein